MTRQKARYWLIFIVAITLIALFLDYPSLFDRGVNWLNDAAGFGLPNFWKMPFRLGLDLAGGTYLLYQADLSNIEKSGQDSAMSGIRDVIERRVNLFGVAEPRVQTVKAGGEYRLSVELAGIKDINQAIQMIGETPYLDFREERPKEEQDAILEAQKNNQQINEDPYFVLSSPYLSGKYLKKASMDFNSTTYEPVVNLQFNDEGAKLFEELTGKNINKRIAIYLDGMPISAPTVRDKISGGSAQITGKFTVEEAKQLVERLNAGALPVPIKLISQQSVGASLGEDSLKKSLFAGLVGILAVMIFMFIYYRKYGIYACVSLIVYTILALAIFKLVPVTLTLAGVAGFILSVGMAVDANILIFERTREEKQKGIAEGAAIDEGFRRAWLSIRDSNISTMITCAVLYTFTTSIIKGFALTLFIGVSLSMFTAITVTRLLLKSFLVVKNPARD